MSFDDLFRGDLPNKVLQPALSGRYVSQESSRLQPLRYAFGIRAHFRNIPIHRTLRLKTMSNMTLSKKQREELLRALKARFEQNMNRHQSLEWEKVQARLEADAEKLWSLNEMEIGRASCRERV